MINVLIQGKLYPVEQLLNKSVYARKDTLLYRDYYGTAPRQVKKGGLLGRVYSWINKDGTVYLMFNIPTGNSLLKDYPGGSYFVKVSDIDEKTVAEQGAKTSKELAEEAENKDMTFGDKALKTAQNIGFALVAAMIVKSFISSSR